MQVKLTDLYVGKRRRIEMGDVEDLAEDLRKTGQITAITVRPPTEEDRLEEDYAGEKWVLVAGGRRTMAAKLAGWEEIGAFDVRELDPISHRIMELHENVKRKDMTWLEEARAREEILALRREQNPEITQAEVAREIGETPATFSRNVAAAAAVSARPELARAGSQKAVLRHAKMADHLIARIERSTPAIALDLDHRVITGDSRQWLRTLETRSVDLVLTDLPYMIDHFSQGHKSTSGPVLSEFEDGEQETLDLLFDVVPQMIRVLKPTGWFISTMSEKGYEVLKGLVQSVCLNHHDYFDTKAADGRCLQSGDPDACDYSGVVVEPRWIWYRPNSINNPRFPETDAKNVYEHILVFRMPEARLMRPCDNVLVHEAEYGNERIHATQKPVSLGVDIISRTTLPGERVIDPFAGSGNFGRAAAKLARDWYICEKNTALRSAILGNIAQDFSGVAPKVEMPRELALVPDDDEDEDELDEDDWNEELDDE